MNSNNGMLQQVPSLLAGYEPAPLENWYRKKYFTNEIDISGSGVEEYSYSQIKEIGEFDFQELDDVKLGDGETVGGAQIRQIIADRFGGGDPDAVMITNGSNEALQLVMRGIVDVGDEIVTHSPCYHCHDKIAASVGCSVKRWSLNLDVNGHQDLDRLASLVTHKTKALVLNFPNNPTGISISQKMLDEIIDIARQNNSYLVWDAAFQELIYENRPLREPLLDYDKVITVGTFSKAYGAPGLRFGWLMAQQSVLDACIRQKDYGNLFVAPIVEFIALKMLANIDAFASPKLEQATHNRAIVSNWVEKNGFTDAWRIPDGGVCGLFRLPEATNDIDFCNELLERHGVLLVPGSCFDVPGYVRLGFGGSTTSLLDGLEKLGAFLK